MHIDSRRSALSTCKVKFKLFILCAAGAAVGNRRKMKEIRYNNFWAITAFFIKTKKTLFFLCYLKSPYHSWSCVCVCVCVCIIVLYTLASYLILFLYSAIHTKHCKSLPDFQFIFTCVYFLVNNYENCVRLFAAHFRSYCLMLCSLLAAHILSLFNFVSIVAI